MIPRLNKRQILIFVVVIVPVYIASMYYLGQLLKLMLGA